MQDFGTIKYREEIKAYIMENGCMVPHPDDQTVPVDIHTQLDPLYKELDEYAKAHPDKVVEDVPPVPTVDELKVAKLEEINSSYDTATSALVSTYPSTELLTFDKQEQEARAWDADNTVETPLVDMLALGRQMDKAELVRRIIAKADAFALATGYITGQRQRYEDLLDVATTAEEIAAIVPEYKLPEAENSAEDSMSAFFYNDLY